MKTNLLFMTTIAGLVMVGAGVGIASAATTGNTASRSGIARYTMRGERLSAVAEVLGTTPPQLENQLKTETMKQAIASAGLTKTTFEQKVKVQVQSDLLAKGYSQSQIDKAMSYHGKHHKPSTT